MVEPLELPPGSRGSHSSLLKEQIPVFQELKELIIFVHLHRLRLYRMIELIIEMFERSIEPRYPPVPDAHQIPYTIDYQNRKHIFAYNPTNASITLTDTAGEWTFVLPQNAWTNISGPQGTKLSASATAIFRVKCTDELIP